MNCLKDFKMALFSPSQGTFAEPTNRQKNQGRTVNIQMEAMLKYVGGWAGKRV